MNTPFDFLRLLNRVTSHKGRNSGFLKSERSETARAFLQRQAEEKRNRRRARNLKIIAAGGYRR